MKPILFNTEMVQAIQAGRKTETRRLIRRNKHGYLIKPYEEGDVLYVREAWDFLPCITCMDKNCQWKPDVLETAEEITEGCFLYRADGGNPVFINGHNWRPSIHMPKQAARIFLKVTSVRYQDLQDITDEEARNEGCGERRSFYKPDTLRKRFAELWDSTVPKGRRDRDGWAANPDVWVIRFERVGKPEK